ncbi:GTPase [Aliarcobacter cryaerophilus]|uniref:GTPase n=1 Tax=Aliarcobacter cryaerophilus TaxID=28198 RepID=UPI0021B623DB|nr:GTPase [Aliarcobacter cryaerophilus]MCT7493962.1 50S ribosome-binding GTPase [Aliarcobacter cryaerophilus]
MSILINKYLSFEDIENIEILKKSISNQLVNITCMGLYNHGKSSLLNALIKDFDEETFKTADVRETITSKSFEYGKINYIDTPGLNAEEYDDKRVYDAVKESDINIFVHTVTTGAFVEKEIEFLNKIKNNWENPLDFINRTIFVLSRVDKIENEKDINFTIDEMNNQINRIFNIKPLIISVSALRYKKGNIENKNILIKRSNLQLLEHIINELIEKFKPSILETRKKRLQNIYDELIKKSNSKFQEKKFELSKQKNIREEFLRNLSEDFVQIEDTLKNMYKRLGE